MRRFLIIQNSYNVPGSLCSSENQKVVLVESSPPCEAADLTFGGAWWVIFLHGLTVQCNSSGSHLGSVLTKQRTEKNKQKRLIVILLASFIDLHWLPSQLPVCLLISLVEKQEQKKNQIKNYFVCFCVYGNVQEFNETVELPAETSDELHQLTNDGVSAC